MLWSGHTPEHHKTHRKHHQEQYQKGTPMSLTDLRAMYDDRPCIPVTETTPTVSKWTRASVTIVVSKPEGAHVTIPGYVREGLAVHRTYYQGTLGEGWLITHRDSGMSFGPWFATARAAKAAADQLLMIEGLWNKPLEDLAQGLSPTDAARCNRILGTSYKPYTVGPMMHRELARRKDSRNV